MERVKPLRYDLGWSEESVSVMTLDGTGVAEIYEKEVDDFFLKSKLLMRVGPR